MTSRTGLDSPDASCLKIRTYCDSAVLAGRFRPHLNPLTLTGRAGSNPAPGTKKSTNSMRDFGSVVLSVLRGTRIHVGTPLGT
jgi:hypothetical protein